MSNEVEQLVWSSYGKFATDFQLAVCRALPVMATESWSVTVLPHGAIVVMPNTPNKHYSPVLSYKGSLTAQSAGIAATIVALKALFARTQQPIFARHLEEVKSYVTGSTEEKMIYKAIR